jgi:hypothetical protein
LSVGKALLESFPDTESIARERQVFAVTFRAFASSPPRSAHGKGQVVVVESTRGVRRIKLTPEQLDTLSRFPAKVGSQVRSLMERGWFDFAKNELRHGRNPSNKGWKKVFCDALLNGRSSRAELVIALAEQMGMTAKSATVQVSVGMSIFAAGRIASEVFGKLHLTPN